MLSNMTYDGLCDALRSFPSSRATIVKETYGVIAFPSAYLGRKLIVDKTITRNASLHLFVGIFSALAVLLTIFLTQAQTAGTDQHIDHMRFSRSAG
jgi:hypothetical protein